MPARKIVKDEARALTYEELANVFRISSSVLRTWKNLGTDVQDAREVVARIHGMTTRPPTWKPVFNRMLSVEDEDSHEYWKKEKDKAATEGLRLKNAKAAGDMFDRADGERVQRAWAAALNLALAEMLAKLPEQIAGRDHAVVSDILDNEFHRVQEELADLESSLWYQIFDEYAKGPSPDEGSGGSDQTAPAPNGKRVVRGKRKSGSRPGPKT